MSKSFENYCQTATKVEIGFATLKEIAPRPDGLGGLNLGPVGCSFPWYRLQCVGLSTKGKDKSYTGEITLAVGQEGLRTKGVSDDFVEIFKGEIIPLIKNFGPECGENYYLILNYAEGSLQKTVLMYK